MTTPAAPPRRRSPVRIERHAVQVDLRVVSLILWRRHASTESRRSLDVILPGGWRYEWPAHPLGHVPFSERYGQTPAWHLLGGCLTRRRTPPEPTS